MTGINYEEAVSNCGGEDLLLSVLKDYLEAIPSKSADIEKFWKVGDYKNYSILVHALKSSSRLIGATQLSEHARELEEASYKALDGDEEAAAKIESETGQLLKDYRMYFDKITPLITNEDDADARPEIPEEELLEAFAALREFATAFDFDSADFVMSQINDYRIPEKWQDTYEAVRKSLSAVDQAAILAALPS